MGEELTRRRSGPSYFPLDYKRGTSVMTYLRFWRERC